MSYQTKRSYAYIAILADEIAFSRSDDNASSDYEVLAAVEPCTATIPGAMLLCTSSPYTRRGALHDAFTRHYSKHGPVLAWRAETRRMNPTIPQSVIDEAMRAVFPEGCVRNVFRAIEALPNNARF